LANLSLDANDRLAVFQIQSKGHLTLRRNNFARQDTGSGYNSFLFGSFKKRGKPLAVVISTAPEFTSNFKTCLVRLPSISIRQHVNRVDVYMIRSTQENVKLWSRLMQMNPGC
jgi:hypothetical protein